MSKMKNIRTPANKSQPINFVFLGTALITLGIYTNFYDPFNTVKLLILLLLAVVTFSYLVVLTRKQQFFSDKIDKISISLTIIFSMSLILATVFSDVKMIALFGDTQRKNGLLQYLSLAIILIYSSRVMTLSSAKTLIKFMVIVSFILSAYGVVQIAGLDFIRWNNPYNRMIGTLGNPNFASALLAIFLVVVFSQVFNSKVSLFFKMIALTSSIMSITAIISSDSRQGLLTFAVGILFYLTVKAYIKNKTLGLICIVLNVSITIISILGMLQHGPLRYYLYKDSISVRGFYWRAALEMFQSNPLFGVGLDRYGAFFKTFREPEYSLRYGYQINSNNAHNVFLQFFSTGGLIVGLSYLLLSISVFFISLRLIKTSLGEMREITLVLVSAWLAFQAQSIISIDSIGLSIWGWLISGTLLGLARTNYINVSHGVHKSNSIGKDTLAIEIFQKFLATLLLIPTLIVFYLISQSESDTLRSQFFTAPGQEQNKPVVKDYATKVLNNSLSDPQYKLFVLLNMHDMGFKEEALAGLKVLVNLDPINLDVLNSLAILTQVNGDSMKAIDYREKITRIDPWNAENYLALVKLYKAINNNESARNNYTKILNFAPDSEQAKQAVNILN